jgi:ankyrin repeat protein
VVRYLHEHGADLTALDNYAVRWAAQNGHLDVIKYLHENGADITAENNQAVSWAARKGYLDVVKYLHEQGADITAQKNYALHLAAANGHLDIVRYLHKHGEKFVGFSGAVRRGHLDIVKYMHEHGTDIAGEVSILYVYNAATHGHLDVVKYLCENGADITIKNNDAVRMAARNGHLEVVKYLHENGADITAQDNKAVSWAAENGHLDIANYCIEAGAPEKILSATELQEIKSWKNWQKRHGDCPDGLVYKSPHYFRPKAFYPMCAVLEKEGYKDDIANKYAYNAAALFKTPDRFWRYVEKWADFSENQPVHDVIQHIRIPLEGRFDLTAWGDACLKFGPKMARLVKFADQFPTPMKDEKGGWSYTLTRNEISKHAYKKAHEAPELAKLCFEVNYTKSGFELALKTLEKHTKAVAQAIENSKKYPFTRAYKENQVLPNSQIPDIRIDGEAFDKPGYVLRKLESGDIKGLLLGEFTNCCQHIAGEGRECAEHGFLSPYGGFYVVEKQETGEITGQSWVWRGRGGELVLDSFESLKGHFTAASVEKICLEIEKTTLSKDQEEKQNFWKPINGVFLGTDGGTPDLLPRYKSSAPVKPKDYRGYRDSRQQYQVSKFEREIG